MNKAEFSQLMAGMHSAYPGEKITGSENTVLLWWNMLKDMDYREAGRNLTDHIKTCKYPPTIAEIRKEQIRGFQNFTGRNYDMRKLELAMLGITSVSGIEEVKRR